MHAHQSCLFFCFTRRIMAIVFSLVKATHTKNRILDHNLNYIVIMPFISHQLGSNDGLQQLILLTCFCILVNPFPQTLNAKGNQSSSTKPTNKHHTILRGLMANTALGFALFCICCWTHAHIVLYFIVRHL